MDLTGGCYCGAVRYRAVGEPVFKGQCHCRQCQYISGGNANVVMGMPEDGFAYTEGAPKQFCHPNANRPIVRDFCGACGTHLAARSPELPGAIVLKIGTLDDPTVFSGPETAIFTEEMQAFHHIPEGARAFAKWPE